MIARLSDALFPVLDRFCRAITDARHTVGAFLTPNRLAVLLPNIVHGTFHGAFTAADTGIGRPKGIGFYNEPIEYRIYRAAHKAVIEVVSRGGKALPCSDTRNGIRNIRLRFPYDLFGIC